MLPFPGVIGEQPNPVIEALAAGKAAREEMRREEHDAERARIEAKQRELEQKTKGRSARGKNS